MLGERALPLSTEITKLTNVVKKSAMMLSGGVYFLENRRENLKLIKCRPHSRPCSLGLYTNIT